MACHYLSGSLSMYDLYLNYLSNLVREEKNMFLCKGNLKIHENDVLIIINMQTYVSPYMRQHFSCS